MRYSMAVTALTLLAAPAPVPADECVIQEISADGRGATISVPGGWRDLPVLYTTWTPGMALDCAFVEGGFWDVISERLEVAP